MAGSSLSATGSTGTPGTSVPAGRVRHWPRPSLPRTRRECWPREALASAIAAAHEEGARVTAHCFGEESLRDFAAAGVDCIEHATGLAPDTIDSFAAQGIAIVPTLVNIDPLPPTAAGAKDKPRVYPAPLGPLLPRRYETFAAPHDAGVP